ncbi:MAG TPA: PEP/pyruvate-binding domain-containing protein, partial [Anaerolineales bacterium]|nr:PEP/pyruvate-binding domain-containing protein [Anaerolineales bacterium]
PNPFAIPNAPPLWQNLQTFWHLWATDPIFASIPNVWLEFDTSQPLPDHRGKPLPPIPIPSLFFRLDSAKFQPWYTDRAFAALLGHPVPLPVRQTVQTCFAHLPHGARVSHLGLMLSRPGHPLRIYVRDVPPLEVSEYLHAVGFPGNIEEAQRLGVALSQKTCRLNLQLEIPSVEEAGLSPRLSLECKIDRKTGSWIPLLTYLVAENLCTLENKTHLLNWPAKHTLRDPACTVKKYINHIKITLAPHTPPVSKAYLGIFIAPSRAYAIPRFDTHPFSTAPQVGPKAARLGELARAGFHIPVGFVIPTSFFQAFLEDNQLVQPIQFLLAQVSSDNLFHMSSQIQQKILSAPFPADMDQAITRVLEHIPTPTLAIRSSAQAEDLSDASFAGLHDTFLDVEKNNLPVLFEKIKGCYASLFSPRALAYRQKKGLALEGSMAIILQEMIPAEQSGIAFSSYPTPSQITIETIQGSGEGLVSGTQEPERLILERSTAPSHYSDSSVLSVSQQSKLLETIEKIEHHFHHPQDVEWAFVGETLYILQSRPQTPALQTTTAEKIFAACRYPLIEGRIAKAPSPTISTEPYILLIDQPHPQYVPFLENALAVIAEQGGLLNHFAIVCRELSIPFVIIKNACQKFQDGEMLRLEINPTFSPTPKTASTQGWVALTRFIPPLKDPVYKAKLERTLQKIPKILNQTSSIQAEVRPDGIFIHEDSLAQIIATVVHNLPDTLTALQKHLSEKYDLSLGLLSAILVEPL